MKYLFTLFASLFTATIVISQPGTLDKSFAGTGVFISQTFAGFCNDIILQKDGKSISIGEAGYTDIPGYLLVRYNTDGTPDLTFGDSGRVVTTISPISSRGSYGALQEDGKIVVVGTVVFETGGIGYNDLVVVRYDPDGSIDSSFGKNGMARESIEDPFTSASGIAVQTDGKIVVGGFTIDRYFNTAPSFFIVRYNPDGSPDIGFGNNKGLYQEEVNGNSYNGGFALQPDGKILLGATNYFSKGNPFYVRRYTTEGKPDREFGINGEARFAFPTGTGGGDMYAIALREDGRIVCGGGSALVQFNSNGSVDNSFGQAGFVFIATTPQATNIRDIALQPDGKILAGGYQLTGTEISGAFTLYRYEANGAADSSFGNDGVVLTAISIQPEANAIAVQKDGKILLGGYAVPSYPFVSLVLARYNGDKEQKPLLARLRRWLNNHSLGWQGMDSKDISYYSIRYSQTGSGFTEKGRLSGAGSNALRQYNFPVSAAGQYRIVAVDKKGYKTFSNKVMVIDSDVAASASVFPNPAKDYVTVQGLKTNETASISISDGSGTVKTRGVSNGSTQYRSQLNNMKPGTYYVNITTATKTESLKFVKE